MNKKRIFFIFGIFFIFLLCFRIIWMESFRDQEQFLIKNGQLDLRKWNEENGKILLLDGEWEFYPSRFLMEHKAEEEKQKPKFIKVPGRWNEELHPKKNSPYGFASYRLRLYVNPKKKGNYSIRVPSVRSSSEIYVNGRLLSKSGQVGKNINEYIAKNHPYSTTFTADDNGIIDIVIQAANYADSRRSGIVRSVKFGTEEAIMKEMKLSFSMQLIVTIIFLVHSIYAFILFLLSKQEKKLLYFSLFILCITITSALSNDEKIFHQFFNIRYEWDFRLTNTLLIIGFHALLECTDHRVLPYWRRIYPVYSIVSLGTVGITLFLSPHYVIMLFPVYSLLAGISIVITMIVLYKKMIKDLSGHLLLFFSLIALSHHFLWILIWRENGVSVIYYPFDLIISIGCLSAVWFKSYFKMHAETRELATTLQRMNNHKDQFLANTSHEFKNPLHGILNMSQSVLKREQHLLQERSIKELEMILSVGRRMSLILNDLLDVMSLREGNPRLQKKTISIQPIVTGVLDMLQFSIEVKPVKIINNIPKELPPVIADENRLIQIFFNLLHNAIKFTNEGEISIRAFVKERRVFIVITDTGIGMDDKLLKRLFKPYEQANNSETMIEGGFGLGLSISKKLVELHGGLLEASSVLGKGSEFTFSLMLADLGREETTNISISYEQLTSRITSITENEKNAIGATINWEESEFRTAMYKSSLIRGNIHRPLILIIDDDPVNLEVLKAILPSEEYDITTVISGEEALAIFDIKEWDLVISDIMMPKMSGYKLTRIIRERFTLTELPILLLTARSHPKDIQGGFLAGANDYVTKPVEGLELRARIEALTAVKRSVREQLQLEAAWLQAQIQPHFLFNTLHSIMALSEIDLDRMRNLLSEFSDFLRHKFQFQNMDELIRIDDELNIVRSYLYIEQVRFGDRLQVVWNVDESILFKIPFLTLQPLVENAIQHGVMKRIRGGKIIIRISVHNAYAEVSVEDDGPGMDETTLQQILKQTDKRSGIGLINTNLRLKQHFGIELKVKSKLGIGTRVSFNVPIVESD